MAVNQIGQLASEIYDTEFNYATSELERDREITLVSGWLMANQGLLNTVIYTSFSGGTPGFGQEEANIYKLIYLSHYYKKEMRNSLRASSSNDIDWTRLTEGDTTIIRSNRNETAKNYMTLVKENREELKQVVYSYNLYGAKPRQVAGADGGWPMSGSGAGWWPPNYYSYGWYGYPYSRW